MRASGRVAHRTVSGDGVKLAALQAGDPAKPAIVLIHGYPDTKEIWEDVIEQLSDRFHLIAYDVRGAGESSAPRWPGAYDLTKLGDDLIAVCRALAPDRQVHLVGHDWGGIQGWEFVTQERYRGLLASFTTIAGPSIDQVAASAARLVRGGQLLEWIGRGRRSWYILALLTPGVPTLAWRLLLTRRRWRWMLERLDRITTGDRHPAATLARDAIHGANLYRRNIPPRLVRPRRAAMAHVPVQVVIPRGDRFISTGYYEEVEQHAPVVRRRVVEGSHWAPLTHPKLIARWIEEFATEVESGPRSSPGVRQWVRGGGIDQIRGRLALVTGAGSGIGRATAGALAACGARVLLVDRDSESVSDAAREIPGSCSFTCDVADYEAMERLAVLIMEEHGTPQIVVNNAGIAVAGPFVYTGLDDWRRVLDVNLMGVVHGCLLFARAMIVAGAGGQIINTSSAAAYTPIKQLPAYASSKAAVLMLSECLRAELAGWDIGVTAVCPGVIATNITRNTRYMGRPEEDQERLRDHVTRMYQRRNFTPERVASEIVKAIGSNTAVALITPEAKLMFAMSKFAPSALRRMASLDPLPG